MTKSLEDSNGFSFHLWSLSAPRGSAFADQGSTHVTPHLDFALVPGNQGVAVDVRLHVQVQLGDSLVLEVHGDRVEPIHT